MPTYKISKDDWETLDNFENINDAQSYADTISVGCLVELAPANKQINTPIEDKIKARIAFGQHLIAVFIIDNAEYELSSGTKITKEQSDQMMFKFQKIIGQCQIGSIREMLDDLIALEIVQGDPIFTQEEKISTLT